MVPKKREHVTSSRKNFMYCFSVVMGIWFFITNLFSFTGPGWPYTLAYLHNAESFTPEKSKLAKKESKIIIENWKSLQNHLKVAGTSSRANATNNSLNKRSQQADQVRRIEILSKS
jgi:hypothetical protein